MVKRFFRDLKEPLLPSGGVRKALLELARRDELSPISRHDFCTLFEPGYEVTKRNLDYTLPPAHIGTLGYLMRQLLGISRHADKHQMDAANLATVFAPTLFREDKEKAKRKDRRGSQENLLTTVRVDTKLQIAAVKLLIEKANWIGLHPNCYVTSLNHHRSSSAAPSPRQPFMTAGNLKEPSSVCVERKASALSNGQNAQLNLDRKGSLKAVEGLKPKSSNRRSSSAFRGIITGLGGRLLRRSPSRERDRLSKTDRRASSPAIVVPMERVNSERTRNIHRRASPVYWLSSGSPSHSSSSEYIQSKSSRIGSSHSIGRSTRYNHDGTILRRESGKKRGETPPLMASKVLKDNPVSMLGEEHFNPSYREQHERSRRRHTTPVKTSTALRRNQPNTRHSGLHQPKRRATLVNTHEQEKENRSCQRSESVNESSSYGDNEETLLREYGSLADTSADILTQKGQESRLRRVKRNQRRDLSSIMQDSTFDASTCQDAGDHHKDGVFDRVKTVSVACSPLDPDGLKKAAQQRLAPAVVSEKVPPQPGPGSAVVGETVVVTPITASGGDGDDTLDELPTDLPEVAASPPPPKPLSPIPTRITDARSPSRTVTVVSRQIVPKRFACRFLGLLPTTAVNLGPYRGPLSKAGSVPVWSGDGPSNKSQQVVFRMPSVPSACSSILPTLGSSVDKIPMSASYEGGGALKMRPLRSSSLTETSGNDPEVDDDEFLASNELREMIKNSRTEEDMEEVIDRRLRFRPSVAFIQKSGIVRDRVNMFRQLGNSISVPLESISGRVGLVQILFEIRIEV
ncbi:unnamed protein product [Heligmosomoides polygyrus]|uniref:Rho-GAP domain-containing protein n=1 Tax=Heligmosomoides polygyrus TaxID=6339 RepID=A0A3P7Y9S5_HELPZ|nr:unnamed protein product [Heligmosomoides polygyrus]